MSNWSSAIIGGIVGAVLPAIGATWYLSGLNTRFEAHIRHGNVGPSAALPSGVVVASLKRCRDLHDSWGNYRAGAGRMIVGVGTATIEGVERTFLSDQAGGFYSHVLLPEEMPPHAHSLDLTSIGNVPGSGVLAFIGENDGRKRHETYSAGGNGNTDTNAAPHNNMPPYVALYFCEKK